jgi:hypothetical protein
MSHGKPYDPNQPRHLIGEIGAGQWKRVDEGHEASSRSDPVRLAFLLSKFGSGLRVAPRPSAPPRVAPHPEIREPFNPRPPLFPVPLVPLVPDSLDPARVAEQRALERALLTYNLLSGDNDADRRAAIVSKSASTSMIAPAVN